MSNTSVNVYLYQTSRLEVHFYSYKIKWLDQGEVSLLSLHVVCVREKWKRVKNENKVIVTVYN